MQKSGKHSSLSPSIFVPSLPFHFHSLFSPPSHSSLSFFLIIFYSPSLLLSTFLTTYKFFPWGLSFPVPLVLSLLTLSLSSRVPVNLSGSSRLSPHSVSFLPPLDLPSFPLRSSGLSRPSLLHHPLFFLSSLPFSLFF